MSKFQKTLFIFRRDLRLNDNTGLIHALKHSETVIPCFIFTPEQLDHNPYRGDSCLQFMIESLEDLASQLEGRGGKLYLFHDTPENVIEKCIQKLHIDAVMANRDYTPYSQKRDKKIGAACKKQAVEWMLFDDVLLHAPDEVLKEDGKPYTVFTPYYRKASLFEVAKPVQNRYTNYSNQPIDFAKSAQLYGKILPKRSKKNEAIGGRTEGLKILKKISHFTKYAALRDYPAEPSTTHLSAYLKFTALSPREVYHAIATHLGADHALIRALHWRDFFTAIAFFFPHVFKGAFHKKFDQLEWSYDKAAFHRWCKGETGFPLVDAGMREMNETGFMHNRVRMVVASFLTKDLHIDWRWGEKYFAQKLIDYDPAVNNGNWQWSASTGCDAQPYFRIFNPWNQQKKFDPDCVYIKRWIPELREFSAKSIHAWDEAKPHSEYPLPMVTHSQETKKTLKLYKNVKP